MRPWSPVVLERGEPTSPSESEWSSSSTNQESKNSSLAPAGDDECELKGSDGRWLLFLKVPEPKTVKNRMHICRRPTDRHRDEEVERIVGLGASVVADLREGPDRGWAVLADPEGMSSAC